MSINQENSNNIDNSIFKKQQKALSSAVVNQEQNTNHQRKFNSAYDLKAFATNESASRVDKETLDGKKVATVKDRARLRDLIKNIQSSQTRVEANLNQALNKATK